MMYTYIPIGLFIVFVGYILYRAIVKKDLKSKMRSVVMPGLFFIAVWALLYFFLLK
jgi:cytochrome c oxidase assembly factor CtaG